MANRLNKPTTNQVKQTIPMKTIAPYIALVLITLGGYAFVSTPHHETVKREAKVRKVYVLDQPMAEGNPYRL